MIGVTVGIVEIAEVELGVVAGAGRDGLRRQDVRGVIARIGDPVLVAGHVQAGVGQRARGHAGAVGDESDPCAVVVEVLQAGR